MINQDKPTTGIVNATAPNQGETWDSIISTWATETNTWREVSQLMSNVSVAIELWSFKTTPWLLALPWSTQSNSMINISKL